MRHLSDKHIKYQALSMWANYIETGNVSISARDADNQGAEKNTLNANQVGFVERLRKMAVDELVDKAQ